MVSWADILEQPDEQLPEITFSQFADALDVSDEITESARCIFEESSNASSLSKFSDTEIRAASVYLALKSDSFPVTSTEVSTVVGFESSKLLKCAREINKSLRLALPPLSPSLYIDRFGEEIGLSEETIMVAHEIYDSCSSDASGNGSPMGVAASVLYAASKVTGEKVTQKTIAGTAGVSSVTVRSRYQDQLDCYRSRLNSAR